MLHGYMRSLFMVTMGYGAFSKIFDIPRYRYVSIRCVTTSLLHGIRSQSSPSKNLGGKLLYCTFISTRHIFCICNPEFFGECVMDRMRTTTNFYCTLFHISACLLRQSSIYSFLKILFTFGSKQNHHQRLEKQSCKPTRFLVFQGLIYKSKL